jgi:hypothetical protein
MIVVCSKSSLSSEFVGSIWAGELLLVVESGGDTQGLSPILSA